MHGLRHAWHFRRQHIQAGVTSSNRDIPRFQPTYTRGVQSRDMRRIPWTLRRAESPAARSNDHHIPATHLYAGLLLPGFEIFRINRRARVQPGGAAESRDINQNASAEDAVAKPRDP